MELAAFISFFALVVAWMLLPASTSRREYAPTLDTIGSHA